MCERVLESHEHIMFEEYVFDVAIQFAGKTFRLVLYAAYELRICGAGGVSNDNFERVWIVSVHVINDADGFLSLKRRIITYAYATSSPLLQRGLACAETTTRAKNPKHVEQIAMESIGQT